MESFGVILKKQIIDKLKCSPRTLWHIVDYFLLIGQKSGKNGGTAVIRIGGFGDIIIATKLLSGLSLSGRKTTLICDERFSHAHFLLSNHVDDIFYYNGRKFRKNIPYRASILRKLRGCGFDETIQAGISRQQGEADVMIWACGAKRSVGFIPRDWNSCESLISNRWFTNLIDGRFGKIHELDRMDLLCKELESSLGEYGTKQNQKKEDIFVVFVNSSTPVRDWGIEKFINVAGRIKEETGLIPVFVGDNKEIKNKFPKPEYEHINLLCKTDFTEMCRLISKARLIITNESAPMHLGVYYKVPTISIISGGEYNSYCKYPEPYNKYVLPVSVMDGSCFNCGWECFYKKKDNRPFPCLSETTDDYVIKEALEWKQIKSLFKTYF